MIKYFNYLLFTLLLLTFFLFGLNKNISTDIQSILPNTNNKELLNEFLKFDSSKKIYIAIKGFSKDSFNDLKQIEKELNKNKNLKRLEFKTNEKLKKFKDEYYLYFNEIDDKKLRNIDIKEQVKNLYEEISSSFMFSNFDKNDPLSIIKKNEKTIALKKGQLFIENYGYLSIFNIDSSISSIDQYKTIYKDIKNLEKQYKNIKSFSPIFYFVENSSYIKKDASKIALISISSLLILYLIILKNLKLLINTILALSISSLTALIVLILIYDEISVFVLVFGLSISTIAIDYMFHHYFHNNYDKNKTFNKEVFLGFLTTICAFFILSFCDFKLITQVCYFSIISLLLSYLIFSFIFQKIGFVFKDVKYFNLRFSKFNYKYLFIFSILVIVYFINQLTFNFDIKSLDYDNKNLKQTEIFFKDSLKLKNKMTVLIKAKSINDLIKYNEEIKKIDLNSSSPLDNLISKEKFSKRLDYLNSLELNKIKKHLNKEAIKIGFKKEYFLNTYNYKKDLLKYDYRTLKSWNIDIKKYKNSFISYILISKNKKDEILKKDFIQDISLKSMFEKELKKDTKKTILLGFLSLIIIFIFLFIFTKKKYIFALNYLLFPIALILIYLSSVEVNILHIFMTFIILSISVDYAIYSTKSNSIETKKAIVFSSLSSFAGFAVLIFSKTTALFSIGIVATFGIIAILILTLFQKVKNDI